MVEPPANGNAAWVFFCTVLRGVGQIVFQENALTGLLFAVGIALGTPLEAAGILLGATLGTATAKLLRYDPQETSAGIYGFNPALVGIATLFFFQPGAATIVMLIAGCIAATLLTMLMRKHVPFPTYTTPFIVTTWVIYLLAPLLGMEKHAPGYPGDPVQLPFVVEAVAHGVGQIMFQGTLWAGVLFLLGLAISDWRHAAWVLAGSVVGMALATYHLALTAQSLDPYQLVERVQFDNVALGLYGYNATLAAVALSLWRRSLIPPLLGILLTVPLTEFVPLLGVPALTAPFVLATWIVLGLGHLDGLMFASSAPKAA